MAIYQIPFTGEQSAEYLAKARDFAGSPLGNGLYANNLEYTAYNLYLADNGAKYTVLPTVSLPYLTNTALYPQASSDPNLIVYTDFKLDQLVAIARSLNVSTSNVIYSTDTVTPLDNILYIYDDSAEITYSKPSAANTTGEKIVSTSGSQLVTTVSAYVMSKSESYIINPNLLTNSHFYQSSPTGLVVPVGGADFNAGDQVFLNWTVSTGGAIGLSRDPNTGLINSTSGSIYQDLPKSGPLGEYTGALVASWGDNAGQPTEDGAIISFADMGNYYRVTLAPNGCFSAKMEQGVVASRHEANIAGDVKTFNFNSVAGMTSGLIPSGSEVKWAGYYNIFDRGGNRGVVKSGAHTEDGGLIFSLDANTYVEAESTNGISVLQFGLIPSDHSTTDRAQAAYDSGVATIIWPLADYITDGILNGNNGILVSSNSKTIIATGSTMSVFAPEAVESSIFTALYKDNVSFYAKGVDFIGDRNTHTGTLGEAGFGIRIAESTNYSIIGGKYRDFWGDGLFIGKFGAPGNPPSVGGYISDVICDNNRRQGMSIVVANDLVVERSQFLNSNGTSPESGVDSEPNLNDLPNYDVTFRNCVFSGKGAAFNAPFSDGTSDFHFHKCTFNGEPNQAGLGDALQFRSDGLHGISTFTDCTFNGITREVESAIFTRCNFVADDTYLQSVWVFSCSTSDIVRLIDCTITAKGEKRPMTEGGSTLPTTGNKFVRTRFIKQGDQGATFIVNHSSGYSTYTDCELIHQGATPVSNYFFSGTIDGVELVIESMTGDSFFTVAGQEGRYSTVYPTRGVGSPEGVIVAPNGSEYMDTNGGAGAVRYLKETSPSTTTGWVLS